MNLIKKIMNLQVKIGSSYDVIKITKDTLKIDLVILTENDLWEEFYK